jgi:nucleoside-diphosphate-sugar epimerase
MSQAGPGSAVCVECFTRSFLISKLPRKIPKIEWKNRNVLVTGGTSFTGSGIVDLVLSQGARVRVVDDLSSRQLDNIQAHIDAGHVEFMQVDLREQKNAENAAEFELHPEMPAGPLNRVADNSLAKKFLGWEPKTMFMDGLHKTIDWYVGSKKRAQVSEKREAVLTER